MAKAKEVLKKKRKAGKTEDKETGVALQVSSMYSDMLETVEKKYRLAGSSGAYIERFSSGSAVLDLLMGGGYYPGRWYTHLGLEASGKSTALMSTMANSLTMPVPFRFLWDYEGCFLADTELSYALGKTARFDELFDLSDVSSWKSGSWPGQERNDIDTVSYERGEGYLSQRTGKLFYRGKKPTTMVRLSSGHSIIGFGHKFFTFTKDKASIVHMEDLQVGMAVLIRKDTEHKVEEWRPIIGFGKEISKRYQVSNLGSVKSVDHWIKFSKVRNGVSFVEERLIKGRVLRGQHVKDGHVWVALCDGQYQRKLLVHRLVARTFIGKAPPGNPLVLHWNDVADDNRLSNLRYGSSKQNAKRTWKHLHEESFPFIVSDYTVDWDDYEISYVAEVELTGKIQHVFDVSLIDVDSDILPHSIITNGIVTHNSMDWTYFSQMLPKNYTQAELFGLKNDSGKVIKRGLVNYYDEDVAEVFFDSMGSLLRRMPRKMWVPERKAWYFVFENTKPNWGFKDASDKKLSDSEFIYVPAPNSCPQALIFLDSYPAMLPDGLDEDDKKAGMAAQARMFSDKLKLVKPKLRRRHCSIIGVNGIRLRPGVSFGSPEYEPCGEALKFVSDCRVRFNSVGVPKHCNGTGPFGEEKSVDGEGSDRYRYSTLKTRKNKMGPNFMEGWMRIWMADKAGKGHGIDPVFDTWQFMRLTGWVTGSMNKFTMTVPSTGKEVKMGWQQLKELVLLKGDALKDVHKSLKLKEKLNVRKECFTLLKSGTAVANYFETASGGGEDGEE